MKLPNRWRPVGLRYRRLQLGLDLPAWFVDEIKAVDPNFYFVWHPYKVLYDDIMNQYSGELEDPRYVIGDYGGDEVWGWILTDRENAPLPENKWHCWRLCQDGWAHIFDVKAKDPDYLRIIINRLGLQKLVTSKYGFREYTKFMREERNKRRQKDVENEDQLFNDVQKENKSFFHRALDNFASGKTAPTRPEKDVIMSGPWSKRSKITREITDTEGGLILPEKYRNA